MSRNLAGSERTHRVAALGMVVALSLLAWVSWLAIGTNLDLPPAPLGEIHEAGRLAELGAAQPELLAAAVDHDLFRADRSRPPTRFSPWASADGQRPADGPRDPSGMRLLGTVLLPGGGALAMLDVPGEPARTIRLNGKVGELTVTRIERGLVVLRGAGEAIELRVARAGQEGSQ